MTDNQKTDNIEKNIFSIIFGEVGVIMLIVVIIYVILFIWGLIVLTVFRLPNNIRIIGFICLFTGLPFISIPLAYIFKGKK